MKNHETVPPGGTLANKSGRRLEAFVSEILSERGYEQVEARAFSPMCLMEQPIFSTQFETGQDVYGKRRRVDIILYHPRLHPNCLVIQCKWQASSGSVEQKYPYEVLCIEQDKYDTIILLDGGGYTDGAKQWLMNQAGKNRLKYVFNQGDFSRFASKGKI